VIAVAIRDYYVRHAKLLTYTEAIAAMVSDDAIPGGLFILIFNVGEPT
jgi:hypothetical protein